MIDLKTQGAPLSSYSCTGIGTHTAMLVFYCYTKMLTLIIGRNPSLTNI